MDGLKKINGMQIAGILFMLGSIVGNIINIATGGAFGVMATALLPVGIALWVVGLKRAKQNDESS
ncbi:MAG: hypothetical protein AAF490_08405 [Chloroflexota bacterium]